MKKELVVMGLVFIFLVGVGTGYLIQEFRKPVLRKELPPFEKPPPEKKILPFPEFVMLSEEQRQKALKLAESNEIVSSIKDALGKEFEMKMVENGLKTPFGIVVNVVYLTEDYWALNVSVNLDKEEIDAIALNRKIPKPKFEEKFVVMAEEKVKERLDERYIKKITPIRENQLEVLFLTKNKIIRVVVDVEKGEILKVEEKERRDVGEREFESFWKLISLMLAIGFVASISYILYERKFKGEEK